MTMIKAIETGYKGYRFRSRIEARWAVFFDALGLEWEYEKEGYVLEDGTFYLPDFWFPLHSEEFLGWGFYVEIKPTEPNEEERRKLKLLAKGAGNTVMCFWGKPNLDGDWHVSIYKGQDNGHRYMRNGVFGIKDDIYQFVEKHAVTVGGITLTTDKTHHLPFGYFFDSRNTIETSLMLFNAFREFTSARFEHGENGAPTHPASTPTE